MKISQLTLGTVQLGLNYGIANKLGKPKTNSAYEILQLAIDNGINTFDTASTYGDSEKILGDFFKEKHMSSITNIVTKIPKISSKESSFSAVYDKIKNYVINSTKRLNLNQIPICLLHDVHDMTSHDGNVIESLKKLKEDNLLKMIGVSVYSPEDVDMFLKIKGLDVIQVPLNIFDLRLIKNGLLEKLTKQKTIVFVRSIFLQGLFFLKPEELPPYLHSAKEPLKKLQKISLHHGIDINEIAFSFVRDLPGVTSLVVGVETSKQLENNVKLLNSAPLSSIIREDIMNKFSDLPEEIINPSMWKKDGIHN